LKIVNRFELGWIHLQQSAGKNSRHAGHPQKKYYTLSTLFLHRREGTESCE
jgi:hypothetical protein